MENKYLNVFCWNKPEFFIYFVIFVSGNALLYCLQRENLSLIIAYSGIISGIFVIRFFDKLKELESYAKAFRHIGMGLRIWTKGMETISGTPWASQLLWLQSQYNKTIPSARGFLPHKFFLIPVEELGNLPDSIGGLPLSTYKGSIISIYNKIEHLNFMIEKIHLRENITEIEMKEIYGLIDSNNPSGVLSELKRELSSAENETNCLIKKIGEKND